MTAAEATPRPLITVVIVDDHALVADSIAAALRATTDIVVVDIAGSCRSGLASVARHRPHVLLLDQMLPDGTGTSIMPAMHEASSQTRVLLVTAVDSDDVLTRAIEAGACGVISKGEHASRLVKAVRAAANDEPVITPEALHRLMPHFGRHSFKIGDDLTSREREVLTMLATGKSTAALARELFVAEATARNHVQSVMTKLGAHSRLEAVAIATRESILESR
jgi:DNA-binding NarL/FixJ family response regulator